MSQHSPKPITEGFVGQYPSSSSWYSDQFAYPNQGVFYGSAKQAMRQCGGKEARAYKVTVTYVEVDMHGDPLEES
jgi:hypothetical protein